MIKNNESKVKITNRNIKYYRDKGYLCKIDDIIKICVLTMSNMSHNKVMAICEICKNENEIPYSKYEEGMILEYKDLTGRWYEYTKDLQENIHFEPPLGTRVCRVGNVL